MEEAVSGSGAHADSCPKVRGTNGGSAFLTPWWGHWGYWFDFLYYPQTSMAGLGSLAVYPFFPYWWGFTWAFLGDWGAGRRVIVCTLSHLLKALTTFCALPVGQRMGKKKSKRETAYGEMCSL